MRFSSGLPQPPTRWNCRAKLIRTSRIPEQERRYLGKIDTLLSPNWCADRLAVIDGVRYRPLRHRREPSSDDRAPSRHLRLAAASASAGHRSRAARPWNAAQLAVTSMVNQMISLAGSAPGGAQTPRRRRQTYCRLVLWQPRDQQCTCSAGVGTGTRPLAAANFAAVGEESCPAPLPQPASGRIRGADPADGPSRGRVSSPPGTTGMPSARARPQARPKDFAVSTRKRDQDVTHSGWQRHNSTDALPAARAE